MQKSVTLLLGLLLSSCAQISYFQNPRVLEEGKNLYIISSGAIISPEIVRTFNASGMLYIPTLFLPFIEFSFRRGIAPDWELGLKIGSPLALGVDGKYSLYRGKKFASSVGLGVNLVPLGLRGTVVTPKIFDVYAPLSFGYDFNKNVSGYISLRYIFRTAWTDYFQYQHLTGATLGGRFWSETGLFTEVSYVRDLTTDFEAVQVGVGIFFGG